MTNKEIIKILESNNDKIIIETLKAISKEGNNDVLVHVIELLHKSASTIIRDEIINILEYLKEQSSSQVIVNAIRDPKNVNELPILVSACWKNGLNYQENIDTFIDVFIKSDFQLAFDAFTVIDTFESIDINKANVNLLKLEGAIESFTDDKRTLCSELIERLHILKENPAN
jgi:hypothetical protein